MADKNCNVKLMVFTGNREGGSTPLSLTVGTVAEGQPLTVAGVADMIARLPVNRGESDAVIRQDIVNLLKQGHMMTLTNDMIAEHMFVSNVTVRDLLDRYPSLAESFDMSAVEDEAYNIILCDRFQLKGRDYNGRVIDGSGRELFVLRNDYDAARFLKYVQARQAVRERLGGELPDSLAMYAEELESIRRHYGMSSLQELFLAYLNDNSKFAYFNEEHTDAKGNRVLRNIVPGRVLRNALKLLTDEEAVLSGQSDFEAALREQVKIRKTGSSEVWQLNRGSLFRVLQDFGVLPGDLTLDVFLTLDEDALRATVARAFLPYPRLAGAELRLLAPAKRARLRDVELRFPYKVMEQIYNIGYNTTSMFSPVTESGVTDGVTRGRYRGFYIYQAMIDGKPTYAISRNIISGKSYMATYSTLEEAKKAVRKKEDTDKIVDNSLLSVKTTDNPRSTLLEMNNVNRGQILTVLDLEDLPRLEVRNLPPSVRALFDMTVSQVREVMVRANRELERALDKIHTPEEMAALLIYSIEDIAPEAAVTINRDKTPDSFLQHICGPANVSRLLRHIQRITEAGTRNYIIEDIHDFREPGSRAKRRLATLKQLDNNGTRIDLKGNMSGGRTVQDMVSQNLYAAGQYLRSLGVGVHMMTMTELEQFSRNHGLELEGRLDGVKAFIYGGQIYINTSTASVSDLFHEMSHLLLGAMKVTDPETYRAFIEYHSRTDRYRRIFDYFQRGPYQNMTAEDIAEEAMAEVMAQNMARVKDLAFDVNDSNIKGVFDQIRNMVERQLRQLPDNGMGFDSLLRTALDSEDRAKTERMWSRFLEKMIENRQIRKICQ